MLVASKLALAVGFTAEETWGVGPPSNNSRWNPALFLNLAPLSPSALSGTGLCGHGWQTLIALGVQGSAMIGILQYARRPCFWGSPLPPVNTRHPAGTNSRPMKDLQIVTEA